MDERIEKELVSLLPRFRRFALGLARNPSDADDLVQTAMEKAVSRIDQWEPGTKLDSWVFRIIQTTHIDQIRGKKRNDRFLEVVENNAQRSHDGERAVEARSSLDAVRHAIFNLPEEQRSVIMLVSVEGLSYKEAAETLGIPMGTLTSRLVRGRNALMHMLGSPEGDGSKSADFNNLHLEKGAMK